jgi:hypothetical protein
MGRIMSVLKFLPHVSGVTLAEYLSLLGALGFTVLAGYPVYVHVRYGWKIKKDAIFTRFSSEAKVLYLKAYLKMDFAETQEAEAAGAFDALYQDRYGRKRYAAPVFFLLLTILVTMFLLSEAACTWTGVWTGRTEAPLSQLGLGLPLFVIPQIAAAGIGGSYVWVAWDLISRARRLDLAPGDISQLTLRLAASAILAVPISQVFTASLAQPIAFAIGVFPLDSVRALLRRYVLDRIGPSIESDEKPKDTVINLAGIDLPTADKLREADISTIIQLAYTDPVQLCMRTGLNFDYLIDIVSQALAWRYLGDRIERLRFCGLRGAIEIYYLLVGLRNHHKKKNYALAAAILESVPALLQEESVPPQERFTAKIEFLGACDQIANDPYTLLLIAFWQDGRGGEDTWVIPDYVKLVAEAAVA